jgi:hypothetical protein
MRSTALFHHTFCLDVLPYCRPKNNGAKSSRTETSETMSQTKCFLLWSWLS